MNKALKIVGNGPSEARMFMVAILRALIMLSPKKV